MPSITYWSQLQPHPRAPSVAESLAARVRDPAWFLARQWQLGEFEGRDAGSPAFAQITSHTARISLPGTTSKPPGEPPLLEPGLEAEAFTPDLATRVEIGQSFEALLSGAGVAPPVLDQFRVAYPIAPADASSDAVTIAFLRMCAGRAVDGAALYAAAKAAPDHVPAKPALDPATRPAVAKVLTDFIAWVESTWGTVGTGEPGNWEPTRLEYGLTLSATSDGGGTYTLVGRPDSLAELDWYSFDLEQSTADKPKTSTTSMLPGHVRFRGMPNARWWDFEGSKTDFGAVVPDTRDLAKLLFMDFLLLHGDDWLLTPLVVETGSLCWIDSVSVTDVFGVEAQVPPANGPDWSMFSTASLEKPAPPPFLVVPSSASASLLAGAPLEEVHLLRDETADMAWAIEHIVEGPTGQPRLEGPPPTSAPPADAPAPLVYQLSTPLPATWFPLLLQDKQNAVMLAVGTVEGGGKPAGRIVQRLSEPDFLLPDAEVPRSGARVQRVACRARSTDGQMHLWVARRTRFGAGAASSGLRYDLAERSK